MGIAAEPIADGSFPLGSVTPPPGGKSGYQQIISSAARLLHPSHRPYDWDRVINRTISVPEGLMN